MESYEADAVVIGGGVVGLAVARALVRQEWALSSLSVTTTLARGIITQQ